MGEKQLRALANELAKNLKTPDDLSKFDRLLKKISVRRLSTPKCPTIWATIKTSLNRVLIPATAILQRPLSPAMAFWNSALRAIVIALSNRNW